MSFDQLNTSNLTYTVYSRGIAKFIPLNRHQCLALSTETWLDTFLPLISSNTQCTIQEESTF